MGTFVQCPVEYVEDGFVQLINGQSRSRHSMIYEIYRITIPGQQFSHLQRSKNHLLPVNWCLCSLFFLSNVLKVNSQNFETLSFSLARCQEFFLEFHILFQRSSSAVVRTVVHPMNSGRLSTCFNHPLGGFRMVKPPSGPMARA